MYKQLSDKSLKNSKRKKKEPIVTGKYLKLSTRISEIALHFQATYQDLSSNH